MVVTSTSWRPKCDLLYPSFDFFLNARIFCWLNSSIFFFHPRANFWLAWEQLPVFLFVASQSKNVLTLEAGLHPTQGAECINFFTYSLCQATHRSPSQTVKLPKSPVSLELVPVSVRETVNIF